DPFTGQTLVGTSMPHTPNNKYNMYIRYAFAALALGNLSAEVDYSWHDEQTSNGGPGSTDRPRQHFGLVGARLTLSEIPVGTGNLNISLWGKNLEDTEYQLFALSGADVYGEPRSYGLDLTYSLR